MFGFGKKRVDLPPLTPTLFPLKASYRLGETKVSFVLFADGTYDINGSAEDIEIILSGMDDLVLSFHGAMILWTILRDMKSKR